MKASWFKRLSALVLCLVIAVSGIFSFTASADDWSDIVSSGVEDTVKEVWTYFVKKGFNKVSVAGVMGNMYIESRFNPSVRESGGTGVGLCQWSYGRADAFEAYCNKHGGFTVANNCEYVIVENSALTYGDCKNTVEFLKHDFKSPEEAAEVWCRGWERPNMSTCNLDTRKEMAKAIYNKLSGEKIDTSGSSNSSSKGVSSSSSSSKSNFGAGGYLSVKAEDIDPALKQSVLNENELGVPDRDSLTVGERAGIDYWNEDLEASKNERIHSSIRAFFVVIGILITIYSMLLIIAYLFDSVNNFFDIELLKIVTLGKLRISPDRKTSTWRTKEREQVVVFKDIMIMAVLGVGCGMLIFTGKLFSLLSSLVLWIKGLLS